jgi:hypothetical protein
MEIVETKQGEIDALGEDIRAKYNEALKLAGQGRETLRASVLALADCGDMFISSKSLIKGIDVGDWAERLGIDRNHAAKSIHLARNRDQLELDLWPQDVAKIGAQFVGVLPPPGSSNREENDPERGKVAFHWFSYAGKLTKSLQAMFVGRSLDDMGTEERENLAHALRPIAEVYKSLQLIDGGRKN